jgi:hypothetical protein
MDSGEGIVTEPFLSKVCYIVTYFTVIAWQRYCMLQYAGPMLINVYKEYQLYKRIYMDMDIRMQKNTGR